MKKTTLFKRYISAQLLTATLLFFAHQLVHATTKEDEKRIELAQNIVTAFNERNANLLCQNIDFNTFASRSAQNIFESDNEKAGFIGGVVQSSPRVCQQIIQNISMSEGTAKYLRMTKPEGDERILIRLDMGDSGFDYMEFVAERVPKGHFLVVDWFQLSTGQLFSVSIGAISRLMMDPNPALLSKLFGITQKDQNVFSQFQQMQKAIRDSNFDGAFNAFDGMPEPVRNSRIMLIMGISFANRANNEVNYKKLLGELAKYHGGDPSTEFMLIDHYFYNGQWDRVLSAIDAIESRFGKDAMQELLRANTYLGAGDLDRLSHHAKSAIAMEPDLADPYFSLSTGLVSQGKYQEAIAVFDVLVSDFYYEFSEADFRADPTYNEFVESQAFKAWPHLKK